MKKGKYIDTYILLACLAKKSQPADHRDIHEQLAETIANYKNMLQRFYHSTGAGTTGAQSIAGDFAVYHQNNSREDGRYVNFDRPNAA